MKILIIEIDRDIQEALLEVLHHQDVKIARNSTEAYYLLTRKNYDTVLVDQRTYLTFGLFPELFNAKHVIFMVTNRGVPFESEGILKKPFCIHELASVLQIAL